MLTKPARSISRLFLDAGQRLRGILFFGKKLKTFVRNPIVNHLIEFGVPGMPVFNPFVENLLEGMVEGVNEWDDPCTGRHPFLVILAEFEKVEIVASSFDFLGPAERSFGDGEKGQAGGMAKAF